MTTFFETQQCGCCSQITVSAKLINYVWPIEEAGAPQLFIGTEQALEFVKWGFFLVCFFFVPEMEEADEEN